ncbi:ArgE/DapE family deacylase [Thermodesulfobacteriota bacterium]
MTDEKIARSVLTHIDKNRDEIIQFLKKLVSFPSVTGDEAEIQKFIAQRLEEMDLEVDMWEPDHEELKKHPAYVPVEGDYKDRPNVVGLYRGKGGGRSLLFNGHVDVIPSGPLSAWTSEPWNGEIIGNRLYGRGSSDMKSGLASMTMAMDALLKTGITLKGDVILEYTMDEERTGNGTLACVIKGYQADAGICCETSSLHVQPGCIGRIWFEISVQGKPAGIQKRFEGVNAIEKGYEIVRAVANLEEIRIKECNHPLYPDNRSSIPCMVTMFDSGSFPSAFPDTCMLQGSIASLPGEDTEGVKKALVDHIRNFSMMDPWLRDHPPEVTFTGYCGDSAEIPVDHPIVTTLGESYQQVLEKPPSITGRQGAADIRYLIKYGNTPTVIFGPGLTEQMHATNEWVDMDDVIHATKVLALTIMEWCGWEQ